MSAAAGTVGTALAEFAPWSQQALLIGVASMRFAMAFVIVPVFSPTVIPGTVRNSLIVAFGLLTATLPMTFTPAELNAAQWLTLYAREAAAGITIGFFFGTLIWAMGAAGELIDTKIGATVGQLVDPLTGLQESVTANLLSRLAQVLFVAAGGLTLLIGTVLLSFAVWPLGPGGLNLDPAGVVLFEGEFGRLFTLMLIVATPVLTVLYVIDAGMGLLNRFAQQFNVFALSMPIKAVASVFVLLLILPALAALVTADTLDRPAVASSILGRVGTPGEGTEP